MRILRSKKFLVLLASAIAAGIVAGVAVPALISTWIRRPSVGRTSDGGRRICS